MVFRIKPQHDGWTAQTTKVVPSQTAQTSPKTQFGFSMPKIKVSNTSHVSCEGNATLNIQRITQPLGIQRITQPLFQEYPEDLCPFDDNEIIEENQKKPEKSEKPEEDYPLDLNPFGEDPEPQKPPEKTKLNKSQSLVNLSTNTLHRRKSRKKHRAPDPPKGVRPFSFCMLPIQE